MTEAVGSVEGSRKEFHKAGEEIKIVADNIGRVNRMMASVASSVTEQGAAVQEIARSIDIIREKTLRSTQNADAAVASVSSSSKMIDSILTEFYKMDIPNAVLDIAMSDHVAWKKRLSGMLVGAEKLSAGELSNHHDCRLGKWYDSVKDETIRGSSYFRDIEAPHAAVHNHGKKAAELFAKGDRIGAQEAYEEMAKASESVVKNLRLIKSSLQTR